MMCAQSNISNHHSTLILRWEIANCCGQTWMQFLTMPINYKFLFIYVWFNSLLIHSKSSCKDAIIQLNQHVREILMQNNSGNLIKNQSTFKHHCFDIWCLWRWKRSSFLRMYSWHWKGDHKASQVHKKAIQD